MNLRQLEVFYAIMQAGTVSGAAKNLHVSQPNITRVLAHTEQQLGFSLFERVKGRLVPTQEAHRLLPDVEKIYRQLGEFQTLTEKVRSGHQHIRVGAPPILASKLLPPIVTKVNQQYGYSIDLMTGNHSELCQALLTNELDIAITFGEETPAGISHERLIKETMRVLLPKDHLSHNLEQDSSISLSAVLANDIGIIALDDRDPLGVRLAAAIRAINPDFYASFTVRSYNAGAELAKLGAGIAIVDPWTADQYKNEENLKCVALSDSIDCSVSLLTSDIHAMSIATKNLLSILKASNTSL
ncbi:LysR family transcriptional regulator [Vibrio maritimus]|uniref:LysR family transcriptional regulator n=1 Tax=Vibrio maritimus TaxID=990268 RepID=UPI001F482FA0|nr:LysR family transcriptional regulator [Vibrio maritimus]